MIDPHRYMLPWVTLIHTATFFLAELDVHLQETLGLSVTEQELLNQLEKRGGEWTMTEFADALGLSKAGITKLVDRLEKAGLVERSPSPEDRRVTHLRMTGEGQRLVRRSRRVLEKWVDANFGRLLNATELDNLRAALRKLLEAHGRWVPQMDYLRGQGPRPA